MLRQTLARTARPLASANVFKAATRISGARVAQQATASETQKKSPMQGLQMIKAGGGMPQLVPFFFVNETIFMMSIVGTMVYFSSKYFLPHFVRVMAARLFIAKV